MWVRALVVAVVALSCANADTVRNPTKKPGAGPLFQIRRGMWGFMDRTGRVVIKPAFLNERDFFHGLAAVEWPDGKWGYINERGKFAIPARFDEARDFIDDLAPVRIERKWGYIDTAGHVVIEPRFRAAGEFHDGLARIYVWSTTRCDQGVFTSENAPWYAFRFWEDSGLDSGGCFANEGRFGYIDKSGKVVMEPRFIVAKDFSEGMAVVRIDISSSCNFGYVDRTGRIAIALRFCQAGPFSEGLAAVETSAGGFGRKVVDIAWGFIDKTGALSIPDKYRLAGDFSEGLARVEVGSGAMGYVDRSGAVAVPARFSEAWDFSDGLAVVCDDDCVYIDHSGSPVPALSKMDASWPFSDGLAVLGMMPPQAYIDKRGRVIAPYDDGPPYPQGHATLSTAMTLQ